MTASNPNLALLRHTLATLAYRASKAVRGVPPEFAGFAGAGHTPAKILAHMGDLMIWALGLATGQSIWAPAEPLPWDQEVARFFASLEALDRHMAGVETVESAERLFQGPIADALTHTGQLAMLRRLAGCPFHGENYFVADVVVGVVGLEQAAPRVKF